ncbi:GGDEF domain-containing protein [Xinfangfangia sp. D13-10-4-6]|uniref:putative bifunctional diguanylate cyclase/phosphodiesterase n=1 Tax=Pseudogemmobacter hezensis TaxID=2737662 RepID=UPI0015580149|nr:bifunctional diguanylate cyclase/phosphodiesterase [Pseudogemmobacter hezensis]NPD17239.1 GGDEF domain-containing protein [Pseudogemmobacter hezensis]
MSVLQLSARTRRILRPFGWFRRPEFLLFLPALTLAGFWLGGERALILIALGLPLIIAIAGPDPGRTALIAGDQDEGSSLQRAISAMDRMLPSVSENGRNTACVIVQFDNLSVILERHGRAAHAEVLERATDRIRGALRAGDFVTNPLGASAVVVMSPVRRLDLESMIQLCSRLQDAVAEPISLGGARLYITCSIGFCIGGLSPEATGRSLLDAAQAAADEAMAHGPGAIRAFSRDMAERKVARAALRDDLEEALDKGEIKAWFQPQISTDTGEISGLEALARWHHPTRGVIPPGDFLPLVESSDLSDRLSEAMLSNSLIALSAWDKAGLQVPSVSVNFSAAELRNPRLPDRIRWELDRFALKPARLTVEILETVVAQAENDVIVSNIAQLAAMGCGIDLDDFGTGHASISTIRRFAIRRLKIDRSFVTRVDQDRDQQRMVAAIISLSDRLGLETLAEGVETANEHSMLSQLGCGFVQGYGIERPLQPEDATEWIRKHQSRPDRIPRIGASGR